MARVGVVGGGPCGVSAALEAASMGADVVIFESAESLPTLRSSWPAILSGGRASRPSDEPALRRLGIQLNLGQTVERVGRGTLTLSRATRAFDSLVLATGSAPVSESLPGAGKRGVHTLADESSFTTLKEHLGDYGSVAIRGSGFAAAAVADRISETGKKVTLFARSGLLSSQLAVGPWRRVTYSAEARGVMLVESGIDKAVGMGRVEAVLSSGKVFPCDAVVALPRLEPALPSCSLRIGPHGGAVVDGSMASSEMGVFAAGDCAEISVGASTVPVVFESSAFAMGRIAGANAAGAAVSRRLSGAYLGRLFGVEVCAVGLTLAQARACGLNAEEYSNDSANGPACSLVVEKGTLTLLGAQLAGDGAGRISELIALAVSAGIGLRELAYHESPSSTDITPVAETATEALSKIEFSGKGACVRPRRARAPLPGALLPGRQQARD